MKFSKYFMLAGAAALFAACSSEEPGVNGGNSVEEEGMYLAINVVGADTRAGDAAELPDESKINKLQVFILDDQENLYFYKTVEKNAISNGQAKFTVTAATYADMQAKLERGAKMSVIVYANGKDNLTTSDQILHGSTNQVPWGTDSGDAGKNPNGFIMSNAKECLQAFNAPGADVDGSEDHPWVITEPIELSRLTARFEWGSANKDSYVPLHESGMKMTIAGFDVETFVKSVFRISQFSADGLVPASLTKENHCHYEPTATLKYRTTEKVQTDAISRYEDYQYYITKTNKYLYKRPNTVSKTYNFTYDQKDFNAVPYAVVKVKFECPNFAGTGVESESMKQGKKVYAIDGVFIGGFEDFLALRKAGKEFKVSFTEKSGEKVNFSEAEKNNIKLIVENYNRMLKMTLPSENPNTSIKDEKWFQQGLGDKADIYEADEDGNYYTYYGSLIIHDGTATDPCWKYGISRNTAYALSVNSIKYLGNNGNGEAGEGPTPADMSDMNLTLSVKVAPWTLNLENNWDL